jgi:hypothetical protein
MLCLTSAGAIAAYSYYARDDAGEPVYTVPSPTSAPSTPRSGSPRPIPSDDQAALARELQRELKRVGCYSGEVNGVWTGTSRLAMKSFLERVNAALPIDKPDPVLLSLVQGHRERTCGGGCPTGQTALAGGACVPSAVAAADKQAPPDARWDDKAGAAVGGAAAAAGMALTGPGGGAKKDAKTSTPEAGTSISAPPEPKPAKRQRRPANRPPKVLSDLMKLFGQ